MALTLLSRNTGKGVRLCLKPDALTLNPEHQASLKKVMAKEADEGEAERWPCRMVFLNPDRGIAERSGTISLQSQSILIKKSRAGHAGSSSNQFDGRVIREKYMIHDYSKEIDEHWPTIELAWNEHKDN